ncbi:Endo-1,4-beta-xylanase A [Beauveria bassiana]|uniref:Endo-1,4-beta-xylanase A n=1 Tax=Beauveria bassiana TaxID=176275 RepID=A0A2N6NKH0_BEABA|nr:Endo-1,4-beta-xylanase A [Beauveria bassiana]
MVSADEKGPEYWVKQENLLYKLLIEYRKELNVPNPDIARSPSLDQVAQAHAENPYFEAAGSTCNAHSWPATADKEAKWKSCCFAMGQKDTSPCMWNKPREITGDQYKGDGFEVYYGGDPNVYTAPDTAEDCLNAFKLSDNHRPVLINNGTWTEMKWEAVGCDATPDNDSGVAKIWTQCGGKNWTGPTVCAEGLVCKKFGVWYSQCKPAA